jgi:hypothetical protein
VKLCTTENNSVYSGPGKQSTSLVNGLYLADSIGTVLQTEFNALVWWDLRNGAPTDSNGHLAGNQNSSLYGWRQYGDYGILSSPSTLTGETTSYDPYPTYYVMRLLSHFARGGDTVTQASSDSKLVSAFASKRADGSLSLLVTNKSSTNILPTDFSLTGFTPQSTATVYSYRIPQDNAADTGSGSPDSAFSSQSLSASSFTLSLPPYSATVLTMTAVGAASVTPPQNREVTAGQTTTFTVTADGTPAPAYQWQYSRDGGSTWASLANDSTYSGVRTTTLTVAKAGLGLKGYLTGAWQPTKWERRRVLPRF